MSTACWIFCFLAAAIPLRAESVNVAAAADLNFAIQEIIQNFENDTGNVVHLTLGSSGNFYAQILNGAPFDVFLSADTAYPKQLEQEGYAVSGSTFPYGVGRIVLWIPNRSPLDANKLGMTSLLNDSVKKIAIANPAHAPYGRAAAAAMEYAKLYDRVKGKLVLGENISQAAQFLQSGAADAGIIALSLALSGPMQKAGRYWVIPSEMYPRLEQGAVLLKRAGSAGRTFHEWLRGPEPRRIFEKYGFGQQLPHSPPGGG
jgi:molybdate transport system substrate-binding protein